MTSIEPTSLPPPPRPFQFSLRTLLLLFVVLGSSMAVFGGWGIAVFGLVLGLGLCFSQHKGQGCCQFSASSWFRSSLSGCWRPQAMLFMSQWSASQLASAI